MAFENLKENLSDVDTNVRSYIENSSEYYQLKAFKVLMKSVTSFSKVLLIGAMIMMILFMFSLAASFSIGQIIDNLAYGFAAVGVFYVIIGFIIYLLRDKIDKPLLKIFSNFYFDKNGREKL